jgi:predicted Zn-dependent peptidase
MDIKKKVLDNGLTIVTERMNHVRSVTIGVWIKSGSRQDPQEKNGISHFIEHMVFKGTTTRSAEDIAIAIDSIGGQLDAFTTRECVGFYTKILDEHLETAFELLSDIVLNPRFPEEELEKERNVIFEEIGMVEDTPQDLVHEIFTERFWKDHPLGRPIAGTKKSVAAISRGDLADYFRRAYSPSNIIIAAAGHLEHQKIVSMVKKYFEPLTGKKNGWKDYPPTVFPHLIKRNKEHLEQAHICLGTVGPSATSKQRYAAHTLNNILGGGLSSRLFQNIREKRGLTYAIYSSLSVFKDAGNLVIYAGASAQTASEVIDLIIKELKKLQDGDVTAAELQRSKDNMKGAIVLSLESTSSRMSNLAQQELYFNRQVSIDEVIKNIDRVTLKEVQEAAEEIFDNRYLSMTILGNLNDVKINKRKIRIV